LHRLGTDDFEGVVEIAKVLAQSIVAAVLTALEQGGEERPPPDFWVGQLQQRVDVALGHRTQNAAGGVCVLLRHVASIPNALGALLVLKHYEDVDALVSRASAFPFERKAVADAPGLTTVPLPQAFSQAAVDIRQTDAAEEARK
jgi:hypothetical protein